MKKFVSFAWKKPSDEKIPLSSKNCVGDHGAIIKLKRCQRPPEKSGKEKMADSRVTEPELPNPEGQPMSLLRKFAMFLSIDVIALYFLAFAWLIPCRNLSCRSEHVWTVDLKNISISTNLEVSDVFGLERLLFGYIRESDDSKGGVIALTSAGSVIWNASVGCKPIGCHCNVADVNKDGIVDCLILGQACLLAFNASNGYIFWSRELNTSTSIMTVRDCEDVDVDWILVVEDADFQGRSVSDQLRTGNIKMAVLDDRNGTLVKNIPLPCDSFPKQLVSWISQDNVTQIAFQCSHNNRAEVRLISETDLCNLVQGRTPKMGGFSLVFRFGSSAAVEDVFLLPLNHMGLVVSWSTVVAMVTGSKTPPRLLWQALSGNIRSTIKFLLGGHFTSSKLEQIAVIMHNNLSNSVAVVNVLNGKETTQAELGFGEVLSVVSIPRGKATGKENDLEKIDSLLIVKESENFLDENITDSDGLDFSGESDVSTETQHHPVQFKSYLLLTFGKENNVTELLKENGRTEIAVRGGPCATVILATLTSNGSTSISSHDLEDKHNSETPCFCS